MVLSRSFIVNAVMSCVPACAISALLSLADGEGPALRPGLSAGSVQTNSTKPNSTESTKAIIPYRMRKDRSAANSMARYHWLDRAAEANPQLIESITDFHSAAKILFKHPRLGDIAEADHYLCRRLTRWKDVARQLAFSPQADRVIALNPEGIYRATKNDRRLGKILARNPMFHHMIGENPDLERLLSTYM